MKELSLSFGHFKREDELPLTIIVNGCTYQSQSLVDATKKTYFEMGKQQGMELSADNTYSDKEMSRMHDAWYDAGYEARKRDQFNYDKLIDEANEKSRKTGYDDGFEEGKSAGYDAGYEEGFEIGKREANDKKPDSDNVIIGLHHVWFDEGYKKGYEAGKSESYGRGWIEGHNEASIKQFDEYSVKLEERYKSKYDAGYNDGFEEGKSEGFEEGKCAGYDEGYEAGKRDQFNDDNKLIDESNEKNTKLIDEGMKVARKLGYNEGFEEGKCAGYDEGFEIGKREANDKKPDYIPNEFDKGYSLGYQAAKLERKDTTYSDNVITRLNHAWYDEGYKKGYDDGISKINLNTEPVEQTELSKEYDKGFTKGYEEGYSDAKEGGQAEGYIDRREQSKPMIESGDEEDGELIGPEQTEYDKGYEDGRMDIMQFIGNNRG